MIYTIERANLLAEQFNRFKSSHAHHLAGLFANIDFWLGEVESAFRIIDQYSARFSVLCEAQQQWVDTYNTKEYRYCPMCGGRCEFADGTPEPPRRTSSAELEAARLDLKESAREFLIRCYRSGLLDKTGLKELLNRIGTSVEPADLEDRQ